MAINRLPDPGDEFVQLGVVVVRDHRARRSTLRLVKHQNEGSQEAKLAVSVAVGWSSGPESTEHPIGVDCPGKLEEVHVRDGQVVLDGLDLAWR
jgi:hypothetical protein